ncbi:class I SAM-dependent methyltransferase [Bacillus sp. FSL W7-1360]
MDWTKTFYKQQLEWSRADSTLNNEIHLLHQERVDIIARLIPTATHILELGGGNGQFAVAAAKRGYRVTMIDIVPELITQAKQLASEHHVRSQIQFVTGSFYNVDLPDRYDAVCYWDGFGIGSDKDQQHLLSRIDNWLTDQGTALIDIYTPWYWAQAHGQTMQFGEIKRQYTFDAVTCCMIDTWTHVDEENNAVKQTLRCYSPADLALLLDETTLQLKDCEPGGKFDYIHSKWHPSVPLHEAMTFLAVLAKLNR